MAYYSVIDGNLCVAARAPAGAKLFKHQIRLLLPPFVTDLHQSLQAWSKAGYSPGPIYARRIYFDQNGLLTFFFFDGEQPMPLAQSDDARTLAAWLVLLDKWMETFVVLARARTVWSVAALAGALPFVTPAYLPEKLVAHPPNNWEQVAQALALAIADGELTGTPTNQHWQPQILQE